MLLKRLNVPAYIAPIIPLLDSHGVRTTEQITLTKRDTLLNLCTPESPFTDRISLVAALDDLIALVIARTPLQRANEVAPVKPRDGGAIFGLYAIDELLGPPPCVVEVCGAKGTGKSLLALHATLQSLAADTTTTARWIDTEGAFNATRARNVVTALGFEESVLDRLTISNVFRLEPEFFDAIDEIRSEERTSLLVIDNVSVLFRDALMGSTAQGHAAMVTAMEVVSELTYAKELLCIVTNSPASFVPTNPLSNFSTTTIKPSLGISFSFMVDVEILLQDTGRVFGLADEGERDRASSGPGLRVLVEVLKSRISPSGTWTVFETDGTALMDVLPPPSENDTTRNRSTGAPTGRPAMGGLHQTLTPAIAPLKEGRR